MLCGRRGVAAGALERGSSSWSAAEVIGACAEPDAADVEARVAVQREDRRRRPTSRRPRSARSRRREPTPRPAAGSAAPVRVRRCALEMAGQCESPRRPPPRCARRGHRRGTRPGPRIGTGRTSCRRRRSASMSRPDGHHGPALADVADHADARRGDLRLESPARVSSSTSVDVVRCSSQLGSGWRCRLPAQRQTSAGSQRRRWLMRRPRRAATARRQSSTDLVGGELARSRGRPPASGRRAGR